MLFGMARARTSTHRHAANTSRAEHLTLMAALFKTLSDPSRLQILMELRDYDEVCVGDLAAWTGISESAVSHALRLLRAYGIVDELNSHIGIALAGELPDALHAPLARVQNELFDVGADLSVPYAGTDERLRTTQAMIDGLEGLCDEHNAALPELKSFVLPGGTEAAARLHVARTVARGAEIAALEADVNPLARVYLNRVSDLLFILARAANALADRDEPLWRPGAQP